MKLLFGRPVGVPRILELFLKLDKGTLGLEGLLSGATDLLLPEFFGVFVCLLCASIALLFCLFPH